ncbi:MarR family winged helix-turn-helix transcriptional regulator [Kitasatospora sp. NPDC101801]|uniref:MarR family winged helix-turn-helix transcriptional regulator n=1 Tax=Kitasatospora sp. NPDC101801 TaxID=3364103 RepID=UPI003820EEF9
MAQHPVFGAAGDPDRTSASLPAASADGKRDVLSEALREVLTLTQLARTALAERLAMPLTNVEAVEHVVMAASAGTPIGPAELSRRLGVTTAAGTQSVNRLVTEGHLSRSAHPSDRRRQVLDATPAGLGHVMSELAPLLALLHQAAEGLDDHERAGAHRYLVNVATAYHAYLGAPQDRPTR